MPKVKVPWLCSRSQPGIKVIIRDIRGHLLHTVTFLVVFFMPGHKKCRGIVIPSKFFSVRPSIRQRLIIRVRSITLIPFKII